MTNRIILATVSTIVTVPVVVAACFVTLTLLPIGFMDDASLGQAIGASLLISSVGVVCALVLTPLVGWAVLHHARRHQPPGAWAAMGIGAFVGILPFALIALTDDPGWWSPMLIFFGIGACTGAAVGLSFHWIVFRDVTGDRESSPRAATP